MAENNTGVSLGLRISPKDITKVEQELDSLIKKYSGKKIDLGIGANNFNQATNSAKVFSVNMDASAKKILTMNNQLQQLKNTMAKIGSDTENNSFFKKNPELLDTYTKLNAKLKTVKVTSEEWANGNFGQKVKNLQSSIKVTSNELNTFTNRLSKNILKFAEWFAVGGLIAGLVRSVKSGVSTISELDKGMVELRKTTNETEEVYHSFYLVSNTLAKSLGVTTESIISQTAAWTRMGYSLKEASELSKNSAIFANISEDLNIEDATKVLVSTLKAFDLDVENSLDGIISKVNSIGNSFAVSNNDVAQSLKRSAAAMSSANNTLEETIALATAATEITQDAEAAGTMLKTLSLRVRSMDEETGQFDETLKDIGSTIKDISGVSVFTDDTQQTYKSTYKLLDEIQKVYGKLSDENQADILELLAGKRQANQVAAILANWTTAEEALTVQAESAGGAMREQNTYMDSIAAKVNTFKETATGMWQNLISTDDIKGVVEVGTQLLNVIDSLLNGFGGLGTKLLTVNAVVLAFNGLMKTKTLATFADIVATKGLTVATSTLWKTMSASPLFWVTILTTAYVAIQELVDGLTVSIEEQRKKFEDARTSFENITSEVKKVNSELDETVKRIDDLNAKDRLTLVEQSELAALQNTNDELERQLRITKEIELVKAQNLADEAQKTFEMQNISGTYSDSDVGETELDVYKKVLARLENYQEQYDSFVNTVQNWETSKEEYMSRITAEDWRNNEINTITTLNDNYQPLIDSYQKVIDLGGELNPIQQQEYDLWNRLKTQYEDILDPLGKVLKNQDQFKKLWDSTSFSDVKDSLIELSESASVSADDITKLAMSNKGLAEFMDDSGISAEELANHIGALVEKQNDNIVSSQSLSDIYAEIKDNAELVATAQKEMSDSGVVSLDTMMSLIEVGLLTETQFKKTAKGYAISKVALDSLRGSTIQSYQTDLNNAQSSAENVFTAQELQQKGYDGTTKSIIALLQAKLRLLEADGTPITVAGTSIGMSDDYKKVNDALKNIYTALDNLDKAGSLFDSAITQGAGSGSKAKTAIEKLDEALKDYLKTVENQIALLSHQEGTEQQQINLYKQLQDKLHETANKYRAMGLDENSSYIQDLKLQWNDYADGIDKINQSILDNQTKARKDAFAELEKSYNEYIKSLEDKRDLEEQVWQKKIDNFKAEHDAQEDINSLLKLQNDLISAQLELTNASKQRTVKQLQGTEWKWVSDPTVIKNLQDAVTSAQNALNTEVAQQQYEAAVSRLEADQTAAVKVFDDQIKVLQKQLELSEDMLDGTVDNIVDTLEELNTAMNNFNLALSGSSSGGVKYSLINEATAKSLMRKNSENYETSSDKQALHDQNVELAASHGWVFNASTGKWIDPETGIAIYHGGTASVGSNNISPKQNETLALLENKEAVLKAVQFMNVGKIMSAMQPNNNSFSRNSNNTSSSNSTNNFNITSHASNWSSIINEAIMVSKLKS